MRAAGGRGGRWRYEALQRGGLLQRAAVSAYARTYETQALKTLLTRQSEVVLASSAAEAACIILTCCLASASIAEASSDLARRCSMFDKASAAADIASAAAVASSKSDWSCRDFMLRISLSVHDADGAGRSCSTPGPTCSTRMVPGGASCFDAATCSNVPDFC